MMSTETQARSRFLRSWSGSGLVVFAAVTLLTSPYAMARLASGSRPLRLAADAAQVPHEPKEPRLSGLLARIADGRLSLQSARQRGIHVIDDKVQVVVVVTEGDAAVMEDVTERLEAEGAERVSSARNLIQANVPPRLIGELPAWDGVELVRRPLYARPAAQLAPAVGTTIRAGSYVTEGLSAMNAQAWHAAGDTGAGVKVGVIDMGFGGYEQLLGTDLPPPTSVHFLAFGSATLDPSEVHGTACAEIVHDVAPDAEMYLALIETGVDFANAVDWMVANEVRVVSISLGWEFSGPGDGTGYLQDVLNGAAATHEIVIPVAAGNARQKHWQGKTYDVDSNGWVEFATGHEILALTEITGSRKLFAPGDKIRIGIVWNDWTSVNQDYDLYLFDISSVDPVQVSAADNPQYGNPGDTPFESLDFEVSKPGYYGIAIKRENVSGLHDLEVFTEFEDHYPDLYVEDGSVDQPSDAANVISVAAVDWQSPYGYHRYSSKGPNNAPGGGLCCGAIKPDLSAYARVSTSSYGYQAFYGTSAATPHVAGAAALVVGARPSWTWSQVTNYLVSNSQDLGAVGKDVDYGFGRLYLGQPLVPACSAPSWPSSINVSASSVVSGSSYSVQWAAVSGADSYDLEESTRSDFTGALRWTQTTTSWATSHGVTSPTTYYYRARACVSCGQCSPWSGSATIEVVPQGPPGAQYRYLVPGVARLPGALGTAWRCTLTLLNRSGAATHLEMVFRYSGGSVSRSADLANGQLLDWTDVVYDLFSLSGSYAGAIEINSDLPVSVAARSYNIGGNGTFGQFMPGVVASGTLTQGQIGFFPVIRSSSVFRTNVGFGNLGTLSCRVRVKVMSPAGTEAGSPVVTLVPAGGWIQINRVCSAAGLSSCPVAWATVEALDSACAVWGYASVIDNITGDPMTVPLELP